ncbi:hypothetical protein [Phenylobacterium sp.]|uniref:hypothetical protein n=1 Tax=Phenylobacterium sp. TaxID=1871053 RepID=UPI0035B26D86
MRSPRPAQPARRPDPRPPGRPEIRRPEPRPMPRFELRQPRRRSLRRNVRSWRYHNREALFGWTAGMIALLLVGALLFLAASLIA